MSMHAKKKGGTSSKSRPKQGKRQPGQFELLLDEATKKCTKCGRRGEIVRTVSGGVGTPTRRICKSCSGFTESGRMSTLAQKRSRAQQNRNREMNLVKRANRKFGERVGLDADD